MADEPRNKKSKKTLIFIILILIAGVAGGYWFLTRGQVSTDDAFVSGDVFSITPRVSGYITQVLVADNQEVKKGQLLAKLDPTEYEVALADSRASLAEAKATLLSLEKGVPLQRTQTGFQVTGAKADLASLEKSLERAKADEDAAAQVLKGSKADLEQAMLDLGRSRELARTGAVARATYDAARTRADAALAVVRSNQARWESSKKQTASVDASLDRLKSNVDLAGTGEDVALIKATEVEAQKARVDSAQAKVNQAELNLGYTNITSPMDGFITKKSVQAGLLVARGQPLMAVVPLGQDDLWVIANYKETQLTNVRPGQPAVIRIDSFPGLKITGRVDSIMAGTGAVFSLFPPENASGNFVKIVQRVPVKIVLDRADRPVLRLGLSVIPTIRTNR